LGVLLQNYWHRLVSKRERRTEPSIEFGTGLNKGTCFDSLTGSGLKEGGGGGSSRAV